MAIETRAAEIAGTAYAFLILSTIATCLRVYCRGFVIKAFAMDDWFAVIAQVCFIEYVIVASLIIPSSCLSFTEHTVSQVFITELVFMSRTWSQAM
jgi:hypothetical protein